MKFKYSCGCVMAPFWSFCVFSWDIAVWKNTPYALLTSRGKPSPFLPECVHCQGVTLVTVAEHRNADQQHWLHWEFSLSSLHEFRKCLGYQIRAHVWTPNNLSFVVMSLFFSFILLTSFTVGIVSVLLSSEIPEKRGPGTMKSIWP